MYFRVNTTDTDPAINLDFWFSSGSAHFWNIGQKTPATDWERRIDELMARQIASPDAGRAQAAVRRGAADLRRAPAGRVLRRAARVRRDLVARDQRDARAHRPQLLWAPDTIAVRRAADE